MNGAGMTGQDALQSFTPHVKLKIAALWASTMFCYVYGDFFGLFRAGVLARMNTGVMGPLGPATPTVLLAVAIMMAIPSVMVFLSLVLPSRLDRWLNVALGLIYTAIMLMTLPGAPLFYTFLGVVEVALTMAIAWYAFTWPRVGTGSREG
jgi:hypothetical protein